MANPVSFERNYPNDEGVVVSQIAAVRMFLREIPKLLKLAKTAQVEDAESYRNLVVGATVMGVNPYTGEYYSAAAGNKKPNRNKATICAERQALRKVVKPEPRAIIIPGIVVAGIHGKEGIESVSGFASETLFPCQALCMQDFEVNPAVLPSSLVLTGNGIDPNAKGSRGNVYQLHSVSKLRSIYASSNPLGEQNPALHNVKFSGVPAEYDRLIQEAILQPLPIDPVNIALTAMIKNAGYVQYF